MKKYGIYLKPANGLAGAWLIRVSRDSDADDNHLEWIFETSIGDQMVARIAGRIAISFNNREQAALFAAAIGLKPAQVDIKEVM